MGRTAGEANADPTRSGLSREEFRPCPLQNWVDAALFKLV
jgi:hypothetical protein